MGPKIRVHFKRGKIVKSHLRITPERDATTRQTSTGSGNISDDVMRRKPDWN